MGVWQAILQYLGCPGCSLLHRLHPQTRPHAVAALWALSAAISVGLLFDWKEPDPEDETVCRITEEPGYVILSAVGSFYIPLAIILAMYCPVYTVEEEDVASQPGLEGGWCPE